MNDDRITIRLGEPKDVPQVLDLIKELALYEKALHEVTNTVESLLEDGFGPNPVYGLFVAEHQGNIVGIALHYLRYSTWKGKMLYLEDIVVNENFRGKGIGARLFEACLEWADQHNYNAMTWQVLEWNEPAIRFYEKYQTQWDAEWVNGRITKPNFKHIRTKK